MAKGRKLTPTRGSPVLSVREFAQKNSPGVVRGGVVNAATGEGEGLLATITKPQEIGFVGRKGTEQKTFGALAGEDAPTLTGGFLKVAKVQRFQRVSVTIPEGWDPLVLTVPILFDEVSASRQLRHIPEQERGFYNNEEKIEILEWMAGRPAHVKEVTGEPPYVSIYSLKEGGNYQSNLVPKQFQTTPGSTQQWFITNLTFDTKPIRDRGAERLRQAVTVELTEVLLGPGALTRSRKEREAVKNKFFTYETNSQVNTIRKVASAIGHAAAWKAILEANKKISGNDANKHFKPGTKVKVPLTVVQEVPR